MMKRAFTLVEIMIVVAVIAIIMAVSVPNFVAYRQMAHAKACKENIETLRSACLAYMANHTGTYTENQSDLVGEKGIGVLRKEIKCPIGGKYTIKYKDGDFEITCSGDHKEE